MDVATAGYSWSVKHSSELDKHAGKWVAISNDGPIAVSGTLKELMDKKDVKRLNPFITRIPTKEEVLSVLRL
jgi:hypothetical protein